METKVKTQTYVGSSPEDSDVVITTEATEPETGITLPSASQTNAQMQQIGAQVSTFLERLPVYFSNFFEAYKLPIIAFALFLTAIVALRVIFAIVDTLNDLPLFSPLFQSIGIGYVAWFVSRYLLKAETRQELAAKIQSIKAEIVGKNTSIS